MNAAQFHLMFTHLPLVGLGMATLVHLYGLYSKSSEIKKLTYWVYVVVGIFALVAYFTGDGAEELMKSYPGVTEEITEPHEHFALFFFIGVMILAAVSLAELYLMKAKNSLLKHIFKYLLILALVTVVLGGFTGATGGRIRHTEIVK